MTEETLHISPIIASSGLPDGAQRILMGAAQVFAKKGYAAASVRQLAESAKMSIPMMYYYFEGKEAVFAALMNSAMSYLDENALGPAMAAESPREALRIFIVNHVQVALENPLIIRTLMAAFFGPEEGGPPLVLLEKKKHKESLDWLVQLVPKLGRVREGFSPIFVATMIDHAHHNLVMSVRHLNDPKFDEFRPMLEAYLSAESIDNHIKFLLLGAYEEVFDEF